MKTSDFCNQEVSSKGNYHEPSDRYYFNVSDVAEIVKDAREEWPGHASYFKLLNTDKFWVSSDGKTAGMENENSNRANRAFQAFCEALWPTKEVYSSDIEYRKGRNTQRLMRFENLEDRD